MCVSDKSHLTSEASVHPENTVMYSAGNGAQKIVVFSLKLLSCRIELKNALTMHTTRQRHTWKKVFAEQVYMYM